MRAFTLALPLLAAVLATPGAAAGAEPQDTVLRTGIVPDSPPFVVAGRDGGLTGFSVELFRAIAAFMKRDVAFRAGPLPELTEALAHHEVDVLAGPIRATPERAEELLFTEGYLWSEFQFGSGPGGQKISRLGDLRGKRLAVRAGSDYAEWAARNAGKIGFSMVEQPSLKAAFDAVLQGRADVVLTGSPALGAAANGSPPFEAGLSLPETKTHDSAAVARANVELRDEVEDALTCLKENGTVARLAKSWLGVQAAPEDLENMVVPGYGVPGLSGYDSKVHTVRCAHGDGGR
jgi:polar amino acid transport system substrate-binding protein